MKRGSREIGNGEGISIIASRLVRHRYRIFQNFRPVALVAKPVDERKKLGGGSEQSNIQKAPATTDQALTPPSGKGWLSEGPKPFFSGLSSGSSVSLSSSEVGSRRRPISKEEEPVP